MLKSFTRQSLNQLLSTSKRKDMINSMRKSCRGNAEKKAIPTETGFDEPANSVAKFMKRRTLTKAEHDNGYIETRFLLPTSNLVERFFSVSGLAYDDFRQNMTTMNLEMQLFLKTNKRFWDEELVSKCYA